MKKLKHYGCLALFALALQTPVKASLIAFTDYGLGGTTAGWDIFYGPNYQSTFNFVTGTAGNPLTNASTNLTLVAQNPGHIPGPPTPGNGQATGPIGSDSSIPGNRELFYTFFASTVNFSITGTFEANTDDFVFQALMDVGTAGGISNVFLNGVAADSSGSNVNDVDFWAWEDLGLSAGQSYTLTWQTTNAHSAADAFQIQMGPAAVPEPSTYALLAAGIGAICWIRRRSAS